MAASDLPSSEVMPQSPTTIVEGQWPLLAALPSLPLLNLRKGWVKGARTTFLEQCLIVFREKKSINAKRATEYTYTTAMNDYFRQFFWALPLDQDPHDDDPPPITDDELSSAQCEVKAAVVKQMGNAIPKWLEYHAGKVTPVGAMSKKAREHDPILAFLLCLAENEQGGLAKDQAAVCAAFMASEFEKLSTEDQDRWAAFAERTSAERKRTKDGGWTEPALLPPEEIQRVWDTLASSMQPLIEGLSTMLGSHVSLAIAGPEPRRGGQVNVISIHEGLDKSPMPLRFHEIRGEPYQLWLAAIGEFTLSCYTPEEQKACALPRVTQPSGPPPFWMANTPWQSSSLATVGLGAEGQEAVVDGDDED
ncbi:hypothetical protein IW262DRAFT_1461077 [Armillaria fumosa]|nr:hypothetical protein IW262DRAFT_1461077 [Armillaria fumosa]